jgi:hypothetical protein
VTARPKTEGAVISAELEKSSADPCAMPGEVAPKWRMASLIEGNQLDEVALITEVQWHLPPRTFIKLNNGWGLTKNATDFAPEVGIMFSF